MTVVAPPPQHEHDLLIREARARQRRRRLAGAAIAAVAAASALGAYAIVHGRGSAAPTRHSQPAPPVTGRRCRSDQLRLVAGRGGAAAGTYGRDFRLVNESSQSCSLRGWPTIHLLLRDGRRVTPRARLLRYYSSGVPNHPLTPGRIALRPGGVASFVVLDQDWDDKTESACLEVRTMFVAPPGARSSLEVPVGIGGYCAPLMVPPLVPGTNPRWP